VVAGKVKTVEISDRGNNTPWFAEACAFGIQTHGHKIAGKVGHPLFTWSLALPVSER
jgi:hypothetical protein